jgi:hypothetical protein
MDKFIRAASKNLHVLAWIAMLPMSLWSTGGYRWHGQQYGEMKGGWTTPATACSSHLERILTLFVYLGEIGPLCHKCSSCTNIGHQRSVPLWSALSRSAGGRMGPLRQTDLIVQTALVTDMCRQLNANASATLSVYVTGQVKLVRRCGLQGL